MKSQPIWLHVLLALAISLGTLALGGCAGTFHISWVNDGPRYIHDAGLDYPGRGHQMTWNLWPTHDVLEGAAWPERGPLVVTWTDDQEAKHRVEIPLKPEYLQKPDGILVLRFQPDGRVSVRGIHDDEWMHEPWRKLGDLYP